MHIPKKSFNCRNNPTSIEIQQGKESIYICFFPFTYANQRRDIIPYRKSSLTKVYFLSLVEMYTYLGWWWTSGVRESVYFLFTRKPLRV